MSPLRSILLLIAIGSADAMRMLPLRNQPPEMKAAITGSAGWLNFPAAAASALKDEAKALARVSARVARIIKQRKAQKESPASVAVARLQELKVQAQPEELSFLWEPTQMPFIIDQDLSFEWGEASEEEEIDEEDGIFY